MTGGIGITWHATVRLKVDTVFQPPRPALAQGSTFTAEKDSACWWLFPFLPDGDIWGKKCCFFSPFRWVFNEHISTEGDVSFLHGCEVCWRHRTENKISQPGIPGHKGRKDKNQNNLQTQAPTWGMRMPGASPKGWGTPLVPEPLTGSFGHLESSWL